MRFAAAVLPAFFAALPAVAQSNVLLTGLVRGVLLQPATAASGEFSVQTSEASGGETVYRFRFDARTWIEREKERVPATSLKQGEILEVVCDREMAPPRYARMVHVVEKQPAVRPPLPSGMYRFRRSPVEFIAPRGELTFTGIISVLTGDHLVLRTRFDGEKIIFLRKDTRYLEDGFQVEANVLKPNTRVFMRAGRNLDNELEVYQVIWGEIFEPGNASR